MKVDFIRPVKGTLSGWGWGVNLNPGFGAFWDFEGVESAGKFAGGGGVKGDPEIKRKGRGMGIDKLNVEYSYKRGYASRLKAG
jgi:hypothetical protein